MAVTPQKNDAFFREVDDEVRREQAERLARRYGIIALVLVLLALTGFAAVLIWRSHKASVASERGESFTAALSDISASKEDQARKSLDGLAATSTEGYSPMARITLADLLVKDGKDDAAAAAFLKVANDDAVPQPIRDLATVRATALDFDKVPAQQIVNRLRPLTQPGNAWFGSAAEMSAIAYIKMNKPAQAGPLLIAITKDQRVPAPIRQRVTQLAGSIGVDVPVQPGDSPQP